MSNTIITRQCTSCKEVKSTTEFGKSKTGRYGLKAVCKKCRKIEHKIWYNNKGGREYKKEYRQTPQGKFVHQKESCKYRNSVKGKIAMKRGVIKYRRTENGRKHYREQHKKWYQRHGRQYYIKKQIRNPNYFKAHQAVRRAIDKGIFSSPKKLKCQKCGNPAREYHHHSYEPSQWLIVVPLCKLCHSVIHYQ